MVKARVRVRAGARECIICALLFFFPLAIYKCGEHLSSLGIQSR